MILIIAKEVTIPRIKINTTMIIFQAIIKKRILTRTLTFTIEMTKTKIRMILLRITKMETRKNTMNMKIREREKITTILIKILIKMIKDLMEETPMIMVKMTDTITKILIIKKEIAIIKIVKELIEGITILKLSLKFSLLRLIEKLRKKIFRKSFLNLEK